MVGTTRRAQDMDPWLAPTIPSAVEMPDVLGDLESFVRDARRDREDQDIYDPEAIAGFYAGTAFDLEGCDYQIVYVDDNHASSVRRISVKKVTQPTDGSDLYLRVFCRLRRANRTFRASRIRELIDLRDGVLYSGRDILRHLQARLEESDAYKVHLFCQSEPGRSLLTCLLYLARAEGRILRGDREVLSEVALIGAGGLKSPAARGRAGREISNCEADFSQMRRARQQLKRQGEQARMLKIAEVMVSIRGEPSARVDAALREIGR